MLQREHGPQLVCAEPYMHTHSDLILSTRLVCGANRYGIKGCVAFGIVLVYCHAPREWKLFRDLAFSLWSQLLYGASCEHSD